MDLPDDAVTVIALKPDLDLAKISISDEESNGDI
jgi:hypothetical protein